MKFLVQLGYGVSGLGFGFLAYGSLTRTYPFSAATPADDGELLRLAIVLAANGLLLLLFAARPGLIARIVAPVLAAAWIYVAYMMWSIARSIGELVADTMAKFGAVADPAEAHLPPLMVWVIGLAALAFAAAALDWLRVIARIGRGPRSGHPAPA